MIYVINLDKDRDRMENISSQLQRYNLEFTRFSAIMGVDVYEKYNTPLKPSQLGCFLSHIGVISLIRDGTDDYSIILEDDSILTDWMEDIHGFIEKYIPKDFDVVWIGNSRAKWPRNTCNIIPDYDYNLISRNKVNDFVYLIDDNMMKTHNYPIGTYGIIISKKGAEKILSFIETMDIIHPIDELLIRLNLNKYMTVPSVIIHCYDFDSNIDSKSYKRINPWNNVWKKFPEQERVILIILEKMGKVLDKNNIGWSISGETLLGYARNGKLTPYNDTVEIIVDVINMDTLKGILSTYSDDFKISSTLPSASKNLGKIYYRISIPNSSLEVGNKIDTWPYINIKEYHIDKKGKLVISGKNTKIISETVIGNISSYSGERYGIRVFKDYIKLLDRLYKNWEKVCISPDYSNLESASLNSYTFNCANIIPGYNGRSEDKKNEDGSKKQDITFTGNKYFLNKNVVFFLLFSLGLFYIFILGIKKGFMTIGKN